MSRFIDTEALKLTGCHVINNDGSITIKAAVMEEDIENAPTIDAIPIDWIMHYSFDGEKQHPISITKMIADWRKENAETD